MQTFAFGLAKNEPLRTFPTRVFSTSPRRAAIHRRVIPSQCIQSLYNETQDTRSLLPEARQKSGQLCQRERDHWHHTITKYSIRASVDRLQDLRCSGKPPPAPPEASRPIPSWISLSFTAYEACLLVDTQGPLMGFVYTQLELVPDDIHSFLILTALNDHFVTLQLTKVLRQRMIQEGIFQKVVHPEGYLRIFAMNCIVHDAKLCFQITFVSTEGSASDVQKDYSPEPLMDLVYTQDELTPRDIHEPLVILTTVNLAPFDLLIPVRRVVDTSLKTSLEAPELQFNLFRQPPSSASSRSTESARTSRMQAAAFRVAKNVPRILRRTFSTSSRRTDPSRRISPGQCIQTLYNETQDPMWRLLYALKSPAARTLLPDALQRSQLDQRERDRWHRIITEDSIQVAVDRLEHLGYAVNPPLEQLDSEETSPPEAGKSIPSWILLYLVAYKIRTPAEAQGPLMDLVYAQLELAPENVCGPLLILTAINLALFNLLVPIRRVIDSFLSTSLEDPELQFNLFLQALSSIPYRSVETANNVLAILKAMEARQLKLRSQTYESLLNDRFVTLQLTKFLHQRMIQEGFVPSASHLEAYLRIFAKNGIIHDAKQYFEIIHATTEGQASDDRRDYSRDPRYRANTLLLSALDKRASAFAFLRALMKTPAEHSTTSTSQPLPFVYKTKNDIYDATAALNVAAKDLSTSTERLFQLFENLPAKPTVATHTVFLQGLLLRRQFSAAEIYWKKLSTSGLVIDAHALGIGLKAYTRNGKPHAAFQLLEKYSLKPAEYSTDNGPPPVKINTVTMNEYLVALKRVNRPDVVFRLWDFMGVLYGTHPTAETLSILLQSARLATRMDDCLSGALAQLKLLNPFKKHNPYKHDYARNEAVNSILTALGHPGRGELRKYASGNWRGQLPFEFARTVFLQALFGNDMHGRLGAVRAPARAIRDSYDSDASSGIGLPSLGPKEYIFDPPPGLLTLEGKSHYPQIVVTNTNCFNYITLLGVCGRAGEIPLVLAWMKELGLQPSDSTIAVALVFWAEVSVQAPLVERWNGGPEKNEYAKLVEWLDAWVGQKRLPHWRTLQKWQKIVNDMRTRTIVSRSRMIPGYDVK